MKVIPVLDDRYRYMIITRHPKNSLAIPSSMFNEKEIQLVAWRASHSFLVSAFFFAFWTLGHTVDHSLSKIFNMQARNICRYYLLITFGVFSLSFILVDGEIRLRDMLHDKDKKSLVTKKLRKASTESLKEFIREVDSSGVIRKIIKRKIHIPKDSSLTLTSQVSRPNIFPNIFNQGDGFIVDAVVEWPLWLDLHAFAEAMHMDPATDEGAHGWHGAGSEFKSELNVDKDVENNVKTGNTDEDDEDGMWFGPPVLGGNDDEEGRSLSALSGVIGLERCHIYEKIETGMSVYLNLDRNQSHDCVLRAICEAQLLADFYLDAPSSIFFEVIHLILKPSLGVEDSCFERYLVAEKAAYQAPGHCSEFVSKCPLNIAGLFVRNFFPEIL